MSNCAIFTVGDATSWTFLSKLYRKSHDISSSHVNHCELLVKLTLNMPKINARADSHVDKAIVALMKYPNMTITRAGYDSQWLQVTFNAEEDEVEVPNTQPYNLECQQALANVKSHGGRFQMTNGGMHVTHDDIFISIEMKMRNEQ